MKQLQQLGAIVYPPAEKKDVDWGLLAGKSRDSNGTVTSLASGIVLGVIVPCMQEDAQKNALASAVFIRKTS